MIRKKFIAAIASMIIVSMSSSTLVFADVAGETKKEYFTPDVLFELEAELEAEEAAATDETIDEITEEVVEETEVTETEVIPADAPEVALEPEVEETENIEEPEVTEVDEASESVVTEEPIATEEVAEVPAEPAEEVIEVAEATNLDDAQFEVMAGNVPGVAGFISRIYTIALSRSYDQEGLNYWCGELEGYKSDGLTIFKRITDCPEFKNKDLSDKEYLTVLYATFFDRQPDGEGFNFWLDKLENDDKYTRDYVLRCFVDSQEWANICAKYGILSGGTQKANISNPEVSDGCVAFVTRLYSTCFGRNPDPTGLNHWCREISNLNITGKEAAKEFITSPEFQQLAARSTDEELVEIFYHVFFGREPDFDGFYYWMDQIRFGSKVEILFNGFSDSKEFKEICDNNGIYAGPSIPLPVAEAMVLDDDFKEFLLYNCGYGQDGDWGMSILEEGAKNLHPKLTYKYADVQGATRVDYEYAIPQKDIAAIQNFEAAHFNASWTPAMKVAYTFYWVHMNMAYSYGNIAPTYCVAAFERRAGQCAQYNGSLVEYLCYLGYDACLIRGYRTSGQHYWGELYVNGKTYVIEVGCHQKDGYWNYFFEPYEYTRKYIICGERVGS